MAKRQRVTGGPGVRITKLDVTGKDNYGSEPTPEPSTEDAAPAKQVDGLARWTTLGPTPRDPWA